MKFRIIINPCSGRNRRRPWLAGWITDFVRQKGLDAEVRVTTRPRHATELAAAAAHRGVEVVVAVGGDGTMNEVAQALVGTSTALALVPCGSGNGLALHLGLPRTLTGALQLLVAGGAVTAIDTGVVAGRPFFNAMGLGFDAEVSRRFNRLTRRGLGAYVRTGLQAVRERRVERCTIETTGNTTTEDVLLVAVANSDQYGNHARIAPGARVDDGLLDLVAVRPVGWLGLGLLVPRLFTGTFSQSRHVFHCRAAEFTLSREHAGLIHTDGETHLAPATLVVRVNPRSLRVLVPNRAFVGAVNHEPRRARPELQPS